jgi:hypothetical protein
LILPSLLPKALHRDWPTAFTATTAPIYIDALLIHNGVFMTTHRFSPTSPIVHRARLAWCLVALLVVALAPRPLQAQACTGDVHLGTQAQVDAFNCTSITGLLSIIGTDITNLDGLSELISIGDRLYVIGNLELTNVDGLSSLRVVSDQMIIDGNTTLANLDGLSLLGSVGSDMHLVNNAVLANVDGLSSLTAVGGNLTVENNTALTRCCGLFPLLDGFGINVAGNISIGENGVGCLGQDILDGGMCTNVAVEETTWGGAKSLYR